MATSSSSSLLNLYPRQADELTSVLLQQNVPFGKPQDVFSFPQTLLANSSLQQALVSLVEKNRRTPGGPVSLSATLHLLLTTIGGPGAANLGPEADQPTALITSFLEETGHWPELALPEFDAPAPTPLENHPPERRVRSLAASLASQSDIGKRSWNSIDNTSLAEIARTLTRLEQSQSDTAKRLDALSERLQSIERLAPPDTSSAVPVAFAHTQHDALSLEEPHDHLPAHSPALQNTRPNDTPPNASTPLPSTPSPLAPDTRQPTADIRGVTRRPRVQEPVAPEAKQEQPLPAFERSGAALTAAASAGASAASPDSRETELVIPRPALASEQPARAGIDPASPNISQPATPGKAHLSGAPKLAFTDPSPQKPTPEWEKLFASPAKPLRSPAPVPFAVVSVILVLLAIAIVAYLHNRTEPATSPQEVVPAAAPLSSAQPPDSTSADTPAPEERASVTPHHAGDSSTVAQASKSANDRASDHVLGARERYQPRQSAESLEPGQPLFIAASVMQDRLIHAPEPVHPRVAGLIGLGGMVVMELTVSEKGNVENIRVLGGHHLLRDAAVNAVREWRYRPVMRDGHAIPVRTTVRLDFSPQEQTAQKR